LELAAAGLMTALVDTIADALSELSPDEAVGECAAWLDRLTTFELAALLYDWEHAWARENQLIPHGPWRSWGFLAGRRFGKTRAVAEFVNREAMSGRAMRIAFIAQNEDKALEIQIFGDSGLIETAPPWAKPVWERGRLLWPNGAQAFVFTPEKPDNIRGPGVHLSWATEIQSWAYATRLAAWRNLKIMTSLGYAKTVWDCTSKRRHPILRELLERAQAEPEKHHVVRGTIWENEDNLGEGVIEDLAQGIIGTQAGREELLGEFTDEAEGAAWKQEWIDDHRRDAPTQLKRRIIVIDASISTREGTDPTGIIDLGQGIDDQIYVFEDLTTPEPAEKWGPDVVDRYLDKKCDCIVVERNRGGDLIVAVLRAYAKERGINVETVELKARTRHVPNVIYVKEIVGRTSKLDRATPAGTVYERGRGSHVNGANLQELEDEMTTFVPGPGVESPNRLDALVHGVWELDGLWHKAKDNKQAFEGLEKAAAALRPKVETPATTIAVSGVLPRRGGGWGQSL
jgi:phage terminase large subunit-like protein